MAHENVIFLDAEAGASRDYNKFRGPGWYFVNPEDRWHRLDIEGPYATEALAESEYYAHCEAAYC